ncbi:BNR-4 repeat-containing protein [Pacificimonas sp. ICDLI1SI03]
MANFLSDTFTEATTIDLAARTPETGSGYVSFGSATMPIVGGSGRVTGSSTSSTSQYRNLTAAPSADYDVCAIIGKTGSSSPNPGVFGRLNSDGTSHYQAYYDGSDYVLARTPGFVELGRVSGTLNTERELVLRMMGNQISVLLDGTTIIGPVTNSTITAAGFAGVRSRANGYVTSLVAGDQPVDVEEPTLGTATSVGETSALLPFTLNGSADQIEITVNGDTVLYTGASPYEVTGLTAGTSYPWSARGYDSASENYSDVVVGTTFTTDGSSGTSTFLLDSFSEATVTSLELHPPEIGGAWVKVSGFTATAEVGAGTGTLKGTSLSTAIYRNNVTPPSPDYEVGGVMGQTASTGYPGAFVRMSAGGENWYQAYFRGDVAPGEILLDKRVGGTTTILGQYDTSFDSAKEFFIRAEGTTISVLIDGNPTPVISVTDTSITDAGFPGIRARSTSFANNLTARTLEEVEPPPEPVNEGDEAVTDGTWTWFNKPEAVTLGGATIFSTVTEFGTIQAHRMVAGVTTTFNLSSTNLEQDDHNNAGILELSSNSAVFFYSKHNDTTGTRYRICSDLSDFGNAANWTTEAVLPVSASLPHTYAYPFLANGRVYLFHRRGNGGGPGRLVMWSCPVADIATPANWTGPTTVFDQGTSTTEYFIIRQNGPDRIDVAITDRHPVQGQSSVFHFYVDVSDGTHDVDYYETDGTLIKSSVAGSLVPSECTLVSNGSTVRRWVWDIGFDEVGPRILGTRYPNNNGTDIRYMHWRWDGVDSWDESEVRTAGTGLYSPEIFYAGGICFDANDVNRIYASVEDPVYDMIELLSEDAGGTWTKVRDITANSTGLENLRPVSPRDHDGTVAMMWLRGTYTTFEDYSTDVYYVSEVAFEIPGTNSFIAMEGNAGAVTSSSATVGASATFAMTGVAGAAAATATLPGANAFFAMQGLAGSADSTAALSGANSEIAMEGQFGAVSVGGVNTIGANGSIAMEGVSGLLATSMLTVGANGFIAMEGVAGSVVDDAPANTVGTNGQIVMTASVGSIAAVAGIQGANGIFAMIGAPGAAYLPGVGIPVVTPSSRRAATTEGSRRAAA